MKKTMITLLALALGLCANAQQTFTLEECVSQALQHNRKLQNAALEIQSGREQQQEMRAKYLPEISANVMAFRAFDEIVKSEAMGLSELNRGYSAYISAMQPLYAGGQIVNANKLAKVGSEVAVLQQELTEKEVIGKVTENYWQIVQLRYNLQTLDAAQKQLEAVERQVSDFVETGVTTGNALLQVHLRQKELASNRLKVEHADQLLRLLLAQQIGHPCQTAQTADFAITMPDEMLPAPPVLEESEGSYVRPEQLLAGKAVEAQRLQVRLERGKCLPTVAVGVMGYHTGLGGLSDRMSAMVKTSMTNGIGLATVSVPISTWIGGRHAIRRTQLKLQQAENDYRDAGEQLAIDTESARLTLLEAYEQIGIAKASVEESEENLRMQTDQYRVGRTAITDLLDAETLSRQSHDNLSSAIAAYHTAQVKYRLKTE